MGFRQSQARDTGVHYELSLERRETGRPWGDGYSLGMLVAKEDSQGVFRIERFDPRKK